jgi:hypothetical protein
VRFHGSTIERLSTESLLDRGLAIVVAAALGLALGNALTPRPVPRHARGAAARHARAVRQSRSREAPPRFRIVRQLQHAVEGVAHRFGFFAQASKDAICSARCGHAHARAVLRQREPRPEESAQLHPGFTELVRMEALSEGQAESLKVIAERGQELLSLDRDDPGCRAHRGRQLSLMFDEEPFSELYTAALDKAAALSGHGDMQIYEEIEPDLPALWSTASAAPAPSRPSSPTPVRASGGGKMWVRAERHGRTTCASTWTCRQQMHSALDLEQMLDSGGRLAKREHRGSRWRCSSPIPVVNVASAAPFTWSTVGQKGAMFCITLPTASGGLARGRRRRRPAPRAQASLALSQQKRKERGPDTERPRGPSPRSAELERERGPTPSGRCAGARRRTRNGRRAVTARRVALDATPRT